MISQAVILAAGEGKRMQPLTDNTPKPMLKIAGKPLLEYTLENLCSYGIREIVIIVGYLKDQIINYFSSYDGAKLYFVEQKEQKGTAHAIGLAEPYITGDFLVLNGDVLFKPGLVSKLISEHQERGMTLSSENVNNPSKYGVLMIDDNWNITDIVEKPENPASDLVFAGSYILPKKVFDVIRHIKPSQRGELEITDAMMYFIKSGVTSKAVDCNGYRVELTYPSDIQKAENWLTQIK